MKTNIRLVAILALAGGLIATASLPASPALELAKQLNQAFIEVADKVSPSVVVISVTQKSMQPSVDGENSPWDLLPPGWRRQFRRQFENRAPETTQGEGSGVIIREDGFILTNRHVVDGADRIEVRLKDGRRFKAEVRGTDPQSDVAVLKIDAKGLPAAKLGDSAQTRVGEFAIAIGAPFRLDYSVTFGHVSAKGRHAIPGEEGAAMDQDFIQTDANINPGNSGGPLVNINSEVIGINTLIHGLHTGIGFAIPINLAREVADKLIADGKFTRAWLGIQIISLKDFAEFQTLAEGVKDGVVVQSILPNGPAAKSDLRPADIITAVEGVPVSTSQQLRNEVRRKSVGQFVTLNVVRDGKPEKIKVKTAEMNGNADPETQPVAAQDESPATLGLTVHALNADLAQQFGVNLTAGVIVTGVARGSSADKRGIQPGDIITAVSQKPVASPGEFRAALKGVDLKKGVILNLITDNTRRFVILKDSDE
jgi:serine protease Do